MIHIKNLSKSYGSLPALSDVTLTINKGEFVSFIGPSGCGKSTLLKLVAGLVKESTGTIDHATQEKISVMFQNPVLLPWRTVEDNVRLPLEIEKSDDSVSELLELVGLEAFAKHYPHELSGGMQQRVALARTLASKPSVLLMDEPFGALDELTRERLNEELKNIQKKLGLTIVFVTHSLSEATFLSDRVVVFSQRPASIKEILPIDLSHREHTIKQSKEFHEHVQCIRTNLD